MPKETIRRLEEHLGRVLVAGAHLAAADPELAKDKAALDGLAQQLGAKAPVIGQLAEAVGKVRSASGDEAVRELLTVTAQVAQVRAAQCALAPSEGDLERLPAGVALGTPCNAREIYELHEALVTTGSGRAEKLQAAIDRGDIADLRLVDAVVHAIGDGYIGPTVTEKVLPLLGAAVAEPLRKRFDTKGGTVDGRRLRALVAIEKANARDLIVAGLREGRADLREVALDALADHCPGLPELEAAVLERGKDRSWPTRRAATRALAGYASDASLEALLEAVAAEQTRDAAAEALGRSKHPQAVDRLLAALDVTLEPEAEEKPKKTAKKAAAKKAAPKKAAPTKASKKEEAVSRGRALLTALASFEDKRIAERAAPLLESHGAPAAQALVKSGTRAHLETVADALAESDPDLYGPAVAAAVKLGAKATSDRLAAALKLPKKPGAHDVQRAIAAIEAIGADTKWSKTLLGLAADAGASEVRVSAIEGLGRIGDKGAVKPLLAILDKKADRETAAALIETLGTLGDAKIVAPILDALDGRRDYYLWWTIERAILAIADRSTVDVVRDRVSGKTAEKDRYNYWQFSHLLQQLLERFPGA